MAIVTVNRVEENKPAVAPVLEEMKATFEKIRKRAFEFFEGRGGTPGFDLDDWVRAEHDLFWIPQAELIEAETEYKLRAGVPGFDAKDLNITAQANQIVIQGETENREEKTEKGVSYSEFGTKSLYRRFVLKTPIEIGAVTANIDNGMLTIVAPKRKEEKKALGKTVAVAA